MAYSITQFQNNATNSLVALDNNFATASAQAQIPCTVSGGNSITMTQSGVGVVPSVAITGYVTGMVFSGIAAITNTGNVQARVGSLPLLNVVKDYINGVLVLTGGEIVVGNAFSLVYDQALVSGAGGFHLVSTTAITREPINPSTIQVGVAPGSTLTNLMSGSVSMSFTATPGWSSQDQTFTVVGAVPTIPALGDFMMVNPPSLAATGVDFNIMVTAVGSVSSVSSVATIAIRLQNSASAAIAGNSGVYRYAAIRLVP